MTAISVNQLATAVSVEVGSGRNDLNLIKRIEGWVSDIFAIGVTFSDWPFRKSTETVNTVAGTSAYSLSTAAMEPTSARITSPSLMRMVYRPLDDLVNNVLDSTQGRPIYYSMNGYDDSTSKMKIEVSPIPNGVFTIEFHTKLMPIALATGSNIPLPDDIVPILRRGVLWYTWEHLKDFNAAAACKAEFYSQLQQAAGRLNVPKAFKPVRQVSDILNGEGGWPPPDPRFG